MELFQLRYAVMLSECRNFSRAAEKLFIAQPTLSQQIQRLEKELGFPLFLRNSRQVIPTAAGERFLEGAAKVIQEYENLQKELQGIQDMLEYKITFGTSPPSSVFISSGVPLFLAEFPHANLKLFETNDPDLIDMTFRSELDLAIVSLPRNHIHRDELQIIPIKDEYVCALLKKDHPLAKKPEITLEDLVSNKLIFYSRRAGLRKTMFDAFEVHGLTPRETIELTSIEARIPLIMAGAIALSLSGQNTWFSQQEIISVPITPRIYSTLSLILPKNKKVSLALNRLIQIMLQEANKHFEQLAKNK